uniref:RNase H type-1 domain-containing protein n=1 Tax=Fagus sylvatica TaxID=28930 RepID=A0A2N9ESK5_FAGSY
MNASNRQLQALTANIQELARQSAANRKEMQELTRQNQELIALLQPTRSAVDAKAARLEEELKEMREQMNEMKSQVKAKAAKNLDMLVHRSELKDPLNYLDSFRTVIRLQGVSDEIMCRAFLTNLKGSARVWFNQLETGFIDTFAQLSRAFINNFIEGRRSARPANYLFHIRQREGESLRSYLQCFNKEAIQIDEPNEYIALTAFNAGLRKGDFLFQLCKDPLRSMSKLMYEAQKFINTEDVFEARDEFPIKKRKEPKDRRFEYSKSRSSKLNYPKTDRKSIQNDPALKWPGKLRSNPAKKFFHRDNQEARPEPRPLRQEENKDCAEDRPRDIISEIHTIVGGLASGGTSRSSRKAYARQAHNILVTQRPRKNVKMDDQIITFSKDDARGIHQPHDDTLVVTMTIAGFITRRVLIDNGSSADIIYLPAYQQMKIDKEWLRLIDIPLVGFTGDKVKPLGVVSLMIEAETYPKQVRASVEFLIVDCPSAYNVIIGRPTLNKLRAVTSTYHLLARFPTELDIGELKRDQATARECYFASLRPETRHQTMTIDEDQKLVEPTEELEVVVLDDEEPNKTTNIGTRMDGRLRESIIEFLKSNLDVFAWTHDDMPNIDPLTVCHKLNVDPSIRPLKQKRRVFAPDRNQAISDEVKKLLAAGFVREVYYPNWLANVVMVKKSNNKWRMTQVSDLYGRLFWYNQIMMDEDDQEKTSFITSKRLFCYKVMPFGLKNAGATYQQLMNKMFHNQIGRNVEVYNDDMLVKTKDKENHLDDLEETFKTLRQYRMKLNPSKCVFGVSSGKFLGALLEEWPHLAALNRFVSRAIDKCLPFFKTLRKAFTWTDERQKSFEELKMYLTSPPLLSPSKQGETLSLYLAISPTVVSSALIREEDGVQLPVYYTSKAFQGAEERYPTMEKLALALVVASRKLRLYFQAHTIIILMNHPLRKAMNKPDAAGQLIQWTTEFSEFDIEYCPRQAIKGQALADFIAEFTVAEEEPSQEKSEGKWEVKIDGSSVKGVGGVRIIFKMPEGHLLKHFVRLQYPTTNNKVEYKTLLTGLRIAKALGATTLRVQSDSQLVVG